MFKKKKAMKCSYFSTKGSVKQDIEIKVIKNPLLSKWKHAYPVRTFLSGR